MQVITHVPTRQERRPAAAAAPRVGRHLPEVDLLRAAALLAVVFIHAASWVQGPNAPPQSGPVAAAIGLSRFCVPAFVIASGLVLYRARDRAAAAGEFVRRRWLRTLVPWLAWMPVSAAVDVLFADRPADPVQLALWLVYGAGHLYFLLLVAQLSLLMPFLPSRPRRLALLAAVAMAMQVGLGVLHTYGPGAAGALAWPVTYLAQVEAPFWAGWFLLGCLAGAAYDRLRALSRLWPLAAAAAGAGALAVLGEARAVPVDRWHQGTYAFLWPTYVPMTLALAAALLWIGIELAPRAARLWTPVRALSRRSLGVYVLHVMVISVLARLGAAALPPAPRVTVLLVGSLGIAYVLTTALARVRAGAIVLGEGGPVRPRPSAAAP